MLLAGTDNAEDERDSDDEQDVFALEGKTGQELQEQAVQTLDEAAADPNISRGGWEGAAATQDTMPVASTSEPSVIDATADSLDSMMEQTFEHLVWRCNAGQLQRAWNVLLVAFERTLLHTYRSKFTQFLVYYLCQQVCHVRQLVQCTISVRYGTSIACMCNYYQSPVAHACNAC